MSHRPARRVVGEEQLRQFVADALGADDLQALAHRGDRLEHRRVGFEAERRDEARGAQHAQRIVTEGDLGIHRRTEPLRREIGETARRVDQFGLVQRERERVDREVAAQEVGLDVVGERHLGLAALRVVDVGPEGRDLEGLAVLDAPDRAEALALQPDGVGPARDDAFDGVGTRAGRDVDVVAALVPVEEGVAHRPTDEVRAVAFGAQQPGQFLGRGAWLEEPRQPRGKVHACILAGVAPAGASAGPELFFAFATPDRTGVDQERRPAGRSLLVCGLRHRPLLDHEAQVVGARRRRHRLAQLDHARRVEVEEALVEGLHAVELALGDDLFDLVRLFGVDDLVEHAARRDQHLHRRRRGRRCDARRDAGSRCPAARRPATCGSASARAAGRSR